MIVGVLSIQGDVSEHADAMRRAMHNTGMHGRVVEVKGKGKLKKLDALVIPGGESTTIGKLLEKYGMLDEIKNFAKKGMPLMGTCTGMILLAKEGNAEVKKTRQPLLGLMDMKVNRNAFGRQRESFETDLKIKNFKKSYHAVFIRAPAVERVWGDAEVLAKHDGKIVMVRQKNLLALAFHPELTDDTRIQRYFLENYL